MEKQEIVSRIIGFVGGKDNISNAWHCMTRLRFDLKDKSLIQMEEIKKLDGVMGVQYTKDQLQVVLGTNVSKYYDILMQQLGWTEDVAADSGSGKKKDLISRFMDMVSGVFGPIVPAIAGAGMIKGLIGGLVALGVITNTTDTYKIIDMLASGVFTFLPFFIAASAAKKFKTNQYLAIAIASIIMYPTMVDAAKAGEISQFLFAGIIPVPVFNYSGSVIPIIFGVLALSYIHKWVDKIVPEAARTVVTPTFSLLIAGFFTLTVIGPIGIYIGKGLAWIIDGMFGISPILAGVIVGIIRPVSILVGMHHAMTPIALENFATKGWDMLMPMMFITNLSIVGAAAGCYFKEKTQREKSIVLSSVLSGILGITEPALFGILTKYKKGFLAATIASCVGSAFISAFGVRLFGYITSSVFSIPAYIGPYFVWAAIGWIIAVGLSFILSYLFVVKFDSHTSQKENIQSDTEDSKKEQIIASPLNGKVIPLKEVKDPAFSGEIMGKGAAVIPSDGIVKAPFDGVVGAAFETGHAVGLVSGTGIELIIHVGMDTVNLNGKYFNMKVKTGDSVKKGDILIQFNREAIQSEGYDVTTPVIVTNTQQYQAVEMTSASTVKALDQLLVVK